MNDRLADPCCKALVNKGHPLRPAHHEHCLVYTRRFSLLSLSGKENGCNGDKTSDAQVSVDERKRVVFNHKERAVGPDNRCLKFSIRSVAENKTPIIWAALDLTHPFGLLSATHNHFYHPVIFVFLNHRVCFNDWSKA